MSHKIDFINPDTLLKNPAFSQIAITKGRGDTIYIGGQNVITKDLEIIGKGDIAVQTAHALQNIETALHACHTTLDNLFKFDHLYCARSGYKKRIRGRPGVFKEIKDPPSYYRNCSCRPG